MTGFCGEGVFRPVIGEEAGSQPTPVIPAKAGPESKKPVIPAKAGIQNKKGFYTY
jgi:hypothetical protein